MKKNNKRILAVDPGARETGVALIDDNELIHYGVKSFNNANATEPLLHQVQRVFTKLIQDYAPTTLVIEKPFWVQYETLCNLGAVADKIKSVAESNSLEIVEYSPKTVRKHICRSGKATKLETAKIICDHYPELLNHLHQDKKCKEKYWSHVFDAVAVAVMYFTEGSRKSND
jgi:Holliday junction resolvasome RuvABC endonuclease subunit